MGDSVPPAPVADSDLTGRRLGDYHLLRRLGRGGMADVYLAEQESLGRKVAFKVLKHHLAADPAYVRRFLHEARAAASLIHANIVQVHEVGCLDGIHFMVQEYVEGQNLKQLIERQGTLDAVAAASVMRQVSAALHKAAQQKIIHRDIKPENIMLSRTGEVKVADFGLARVEREGQALNLTQVGVTVGTPLYMSPEQVEGRPLDSRSDLYSFGVTCYQMLAGRPPFEGDSPLSVAVQHLKKEPPRLEDQRSDLPGGLCRIVHKLMAKRPEDRYPTALDVLRDLRTVPISGLDEAWTAETDGWTGFDLAAPAGAARTEVTQQLAVAMQREARVTGRRGTVGLLVTVVLAASLLGGVAAWARRPAPLLAVSEHELPAVERKATVRDQYLHAAELATSEAWQSVPRYFPPSEDNQQNQYYAWRAQQRLAELYLQNDDLDQALRSYDQLAQATDQQFQAIGLAGQANVCILRDEQSLAHQKLASLVQLMEGLPSGVRQVILMEIHPRLRPELTRLNSDLQIAPPQPDAVGGQKH